MMSRPENSLMRNAFTSRVWIAAAITGLAATVSIIAAQAPAPPAGGRRGAPPPQQPTTGRARGGVMGAGPADAPYVDAALAIQGKTVWAAECISCHGTQARGTDNGPNLTRSLVVLRDRYGSELGPFLKRGHKMQSGGSAAALTDEQITNLAHFLRQRVNDSFRGSPLFQAQNVLVGDAAAGAAFFNGQGKCATCHTATSLSLAGIGTRYEPIDLQQRFLFPGPGRGGRGRAAGPAAASAVKVTVTPAAGDPVTGVLLQMDDFNVSLRDASGAYRTFKRGPGVKVVKDDPLAAHHELLETLTDKNMHDVVAYLETLK
jgi:cytochrome c oxidase cbb3-type subunit III